MLDPAEQEPIAADDAEIDAVLAEFGGDPRQAIAALLHDMTVLVRDAESIVSRGFVRGRLPSLHLRVITNEVTSS